MRASNTTTGTSSYLSIHASSPEHSLSKKVFNLPAKALLFEEEKTTSQQSSQETYLPYYKRLAGRNTKVWTKPCFAPADRQIALD
jgi:hypothetical protein